MPRTTRGSIYTVKGGFGIRWPEGGTRHQRGGFRTRTEARAWWDENVGPRVRQGGPSPELTLDDFAAMYLERWGPTVHARTRQTMRDWLSPALAAFGGFSLAELEGAAQDIARWRGTIGSEDKRHKSTRALRQVLAAAVRWGYLHRNPALDAGPNPAPRGEEIHPFSREELDRICEEMGPADRALVIFASETGLRTNEWTASERRDVDWSNPAVAVLRRFSRGVPTPYPKTARRRVPLTPRAVEALQELPPRLSSVLLFPSPRGEHLDLSNWSLRTWGPALEAAGVQRRGAYSLRHTFASNALAAGVSIFELSRLMGASVKTIDGHYGHLVRDAEDSLRVRLAGRRREERESE